MLGAKSMKQGVTFEAIAAAADALQAKGQEPTIDRIRLALGGTGSNTTISKYLNQWRTQSIASQEDKALPPDTVQAAVKRVWQELQQEAQTAIDQAKTEAVQQIEVALKQAGETEARYKALQQAHHQLSEAYQKLSAEKELLLLDMKSLQQDHTVLTTQHQSLEERHHELQQSAAQQLSQWGEAHRTEIVRLENQSRQQAEAHRQLVDEIKSYAETERQEHMVLVDSLKTVLKQKEEAGKAMDKVIQGKEQEIALLSAHHQAAIIERDKALARLEQQDHQIQALLGKALVEGKIIEKREGDRLSNLSETLKKMEHTVYQVSSHLNDMYQQLAPFQAKFSEAVDE